MNAYSVQLQLSTGTELSAVDCKSTLKISLLSKLAVIYILPPNCTFLPPDAYPPPFWGNRITLPQTKFCDVSHQNLAQLKTKLHTPPCSTCGGGHKRSWPLFSRTFFLSFYIYCFLPTSENSRSWHFVSPIVITGRKI